MEIIKLLPAKQKLLKMAAILAVVILAVTLVINLVRFLTTGSLTVTTDKNNTLVIKTVDEYNSKVTKEYKGKLKIRLKGGSYYIKVTDGLNFNIKRIDISNRKNYHENINIQATVSSGNVIDQESWSIAANKQELKFLSSTGTLYSINANNQLSNIGNMSFKSVNWANVNSGLAIGNDDNFYIIKGTTVTKFTSPDGINNSQFRTAVAKNGTIYMWTEHTVYSTTNGLVFNKLYTTPDHTIKLVLPSNFNVAVVTNSVEKDIATGTLKEGSKYKVTINLVGLDGKTISKTDEEIYKIAISSSGNFIAFSSDEGTEILNTKLEKVVGLPDANVNNIVWVNDTQLIYTAEHSVYKFDLSTHQSYTVTNAPKRSLINYLALSDEEDMVYYTSTYNDDTLSINKASLKNISVEKSVVSAGILLPKRLDSCYITLIDFVLPTIQMAVTSANFIPECKNQTVKYLSDNKIDPNKFSYSTKENIDD